MHRAIKSISGNVGIGTASPTATPKIVGTLNMSGLVIKEFTSNLKNDKQAQLSKVGKPVMDRLLGK